MRGIRVVPRARRVGIAAAASVSTLIVVSCATPSIVYTGEGGEITADDPYALPEGWKTTIFMETGQGLSESNPASHHTLAMIDEIEELSNGQITIETSSGYALHGANEITTAVRDGVSQMAFLMPGLEPAGYDTLMWYGNALSSAIDKHRPGVGELAAFASSIESSLDNEELIADYEQHGVKPLVPMAVVHSGYGLLCTTEVTGLDDIRGKITRTAGPSWQAEAEAVGFTTVAMPPLDQFEGLQRGVVDCVMGPLRDWYSIDLLAVADYLTLDDQAAFVGFPGSYIANPEWWESLPPGAQNIIWRGVSSWWIGYAQTQVNLDISAMKLIAESETHEINPQDDDLRRALKEFQAHVRETQLQNPPPGVDGGELEANLTKLRENFHEWFDRLAGHPEIGGTIPDTYEDFAEWSVEQPDERWEAPGYEEMVWAEVFEPYMPNKP